MSVIGCLWMLCYCVSMGVVLHCVLIGVVLLCVDGCCFTLRVDVSVIAC